MTAQPRCLICQNPTLGAACFADDNPKSAFVFCSDACRKRWNTQSHDGRLGIIFGSVGRGMDLALRVAYGRLPRERGDVEWRFTHKPVRRPLDLCPVNTADGGSCPECRYEEIAWTQHETGAGR